AGGPGSRRARAPRELRHSLARIPRVRVRRLSEAAVEERGRLRSHFLLDAGDLGSRNLAVTWVDVPHGAEQRAHSHADSEQVYVIVSGSGCLHVAADTEKVT